MEMILGTKKKEKKQFLSFGRKVDYPTRHCEIVAVCEAASFHKGSLSFPIPYMYLGRNQARDTAHMLVVWLLTRDHILCCTGKAKDPSCKILLVSWYHLLKELSTIPACKAGGVGRIKP